MSNNIKYTYLPKQNALLLLGGNKRFTNIPKDTEIVGFFHDWTHDALGIYIKSKEFPEVKEGETLEFHDIQYKLFE